MSHGLVIEQYQPNGNSAALATWLDQWRDRDDIQVLIAADYSHIVAVDTRSLTKIRELADAANGAVRFQPNMPEHVQKLLALFGVPVIFDTDAPEKCPCGCWKDPKFAHREWRDVK